MPNLVPNLSRVAGASSGSEVASQHQFLVKVAGLAEYFATKTGGNRTADSSQVWDGGKLEPEVLVGNPRTETVTVSRPFKPARDWPLIRRLYPQVSRLRTTVSITPTDADLVPVDKPMTFEGVLTGCTPPEHAAGSGEPSRFELQFAVGRVK